MLDSFAAVAGKQKQQPVTIEFPSVFPVNPYL